MRDLRGGMSVHFPTETTFVAGQRRDGGRVLRHPFAVGGKLTERGRAHVGGVMRGGEALGYVSKSFIFRGVNIAHVGARGICGECGLLV